MVASVGWRQGALVAGLTLLVAVLFAASLAVGPVYLPPQTVAGALLGTAGEAAQIIVARHPPAARPAGPDDRRHARAVRRGAAGPAAQSAGGAVAVRRAALPPPSARCGDLARARRTHSPSRLPVAAITGALLSVALLVLVAGPRASLLVLILAGLAVSSLAGAGTALALNLAPNPFAALEIAFWLLGSLEDRSMQHVADRAARSWPPARSCCCGTGGPSAR